MDFYTFWFFYDGENTILNCNTVVVLYPFSLEKCEALNCANQRILKKCMILSMYFYCVCNNRAQFKLEWVKTWKKNSYLHTLATL